jgi:hypothetical protein
MAARQLASILVGLGSKCLETMLLAKWMVRRPRRMMEWFYSYAIDGNAFSAKYPMQAGTDFQMTNSFLIDGKTWSV